jgi:hypothetical protein
MGWYAGECTSGVFCKREIVDEEGWMEEVFARARVCRTGLTPRKRDLVSEALEVKLNSLWTAMDFSVAGLRPACSG